MESGFEKGLGETKREKSVLGFKVEGAEESLGVLKRRLEETENEPLKQALKAQIRRKEEELEELKRKLEELDGGHA